MDLETKYLRFDAEELDETSLQAVREEIGESEESKTRCLHKLKKDLKELKDTLEPCLEDEFLLRFLRIAKFDTKKALQRIKKYYQQQEKIVSLSKKCDLSMAKVRSQEHIWLCPFRLKDNSLFIMAKTAIDLTKISVEERIYLNLIFLNTISLNPVTQMCGISVIMDYSGFQFRSLLSCTPRLIHLAIDTLQNSLPLRIKTCHVVNMPPFLNTLINFVNLFLSQKIQSRVFLHTSKDTWNILHETFPPEILPEKYGGHMKESSLISGLENPVECEKSLLKEFQFGYLNSKLSREWLIANPPIKSNTSK